MGKNEAKIGFKWLSNFNLVKFKDFEKWEHTSEIYILFVVSRHLEPNPCCPNIVAFWASYS